ncbi:MAG: prepilin-type N-terminal cleavage/methylation domain-containing protein [Rickettsiales bacterium]
MQTNAPPLNFTSKKQGFTLVELSIVLVIIGLLVGGVLVGRDLIEAGKIRAQITQIETIETEINTFKLKYNCLPGDCQNATDLFGTTSPSGKTIYNGDGNGNINNPAADSKECLWGSGIEGELTQIFLHIYLSGIGKDFTVGDNAGPSRVGVEYPYAKFGNGSGVIVSCLGTTQIGYWQYITPAPFRNGNFIVVGVANYDVGAGAGVMFSTGQGSVGNAWNYGSFGGNGPDATAIGIPANAARIIDEKIDDGKPSTGKFGIIAGQTACDNANKSRLQQALLTAYPAPSVSCNATVGKKIN